MTTLALQFALHGSIVLMLGFIGGMFFARAISRSRGEVAWRVVHAGACSAGAMLLAIAVPSQWATLNGVAQFIVGFGLIGGVYAFCLGMLLAAVWAERGIRREGPPRNRLVSSLYSVGTALSLAGGALLMGGLMRRVI